MKSTNNCIQQNNKGIFCEMEYCIYNEEKQYILGTISISAAAECSECILIDIDKESLKNLKKVARQRLEFF